MSATPATLDHIGTPTPLSRIEKEISQQLRAAQGDKDEHPVQRVRMSNLVIYCDGAEAAARQSPPSRDSSCWR